MDIETTRRCQHCKEYIVLEEHDALIEKGKRVKFFHNNCFIEKMTTRKRNPLGVDEATSMMNNLFNESLNRINDLITLNHLYKWIQKKYDVVVLPKGFYTKMASIFDGTYRGLSRGIPAKHILDMWKKKRRKLIGISIYNRKKGNIIEGINLIHYDLAVIMSKYDSYLSWLNKMEILREQKEEERTSDKQKINYKKISIINCNDDKNELDISSILDEV